MLVAKFRATCSRYVGNQALNELVQELQQLSPEFRQWWHQHDIKGRTEGLKEYEHPIAGKLVFEFTSFLIEGTDLRLVVQTPLPSSGTSEQLQHLKTVLTHK